VPGPPIAAGSPAGISADAPAAGSAGEVESLAASSPPPHPTVNRRIAGRKALRHNRRSGDRVAEMTTEFSNR
jgi:hypothetical protein